MFLNKNPSHIAIFGLSDYPNVRRLFQKLANTGSNDSVVISQKNANLLNQISKPAL
jgi:hypothetical protein